MFPGFPNPDNGHMGRISRSSRVVFNVLPLLVYTDLRGDLRTSLSALNCDRNKLLCCLTVSTPSFRNLNSTVPVYVVRVKFYVKRARSINLTLSQDG